MQIENIIILAKPTNLDTFRVSAEDAIMVSLYMKESPKIAFKMAMGELYMSMAATTRANTKMDKEMGEANSCIKTVLSKKEYGYKTFFKSDS